MLHPFHALLAVIRITSAFTAPDLTAASCFCCPSSLTHSVQKMRGDAICDPTIAFPLLLQHSLLILFSRRTFFFPSFSFLRTSILLSVYAFSWLKTGLSNKSFAWHVWCNVLFRHVKAHTHTDREKREDQSRRVWGEKRGNEMHPASLFYLFFLLHLLPASWSMYWTYRRKRDDTTFCDRRG